MIARQSSFHYPPAQRMLHLPPGQVQALLGGAMTSL